MDSPGKEVQLNQIIEERITKVNGDFYVKRYSQGKFLGKGGFAKVYNFTNLETNKILAGKVMPKSSFTRSRSRQKLMTEIKLHKSLHHQHIVKFEHVFEDSENVYILLELCQNQSVNELIKRRKKLIEFEVQCYLIQIVDALKYLHSNRVIHRDMKLGNMFLSDKMEIKIGDFGLAAKLEFDGEKKRTVCGTPNYIAPEILDGNVGHSYEVDTWSLGVIIYTMLYGKPPFETTDIKLTYKRIKENSYTFPDNVKVSENAKDLIRKILITEPEKRLTLNEILAHPFIDYGGPIPKLLPVSTLACPPSSVYLKNFQPSTTSQRIRIATEPEDTGDSDLTGGLKSYFINTARLKSLPKTPSGAGFSNLAQFLISPSNTKIQTPSNGRASSFIPTLTTMPDRPFSTQPASRGGAINRFFNTENIQETEEDDVVYLDSIQKRQSKAKEIMPPSTPSEEIRIIKWYDYSSKYGLGYALSDGSVGVIFNNGTKLVACNEDTFKRITRRQSDKREIEEIIGFDEHSSEIHKEVLVYQRFRENFEVALKEVKNPAEDNTVYIKKWIKTKHAAFFRMNNKVLHVIFKDETTLIVNTEARWIIYIDTKGIENIYTLEKARATDNKELSKRLKYTEEVLTHIWTTQTDGKAIHKDEKDTIKDKEIEKIGPAKIKNLTITTTN